MPTRKKHLLYKQAAISQLLPVFVFLLGDRHNKVVSVYNLARNIGQGVIDRSTKLHGASCMQ